MKRYYVAYGSNLNLEQMRVRCPGARVLGKTSLKNWELLFKGSRTGSYLTIERCPGSSVPVAVWEVTQDDEDALDRYEGCPTFYYKLDVPVRIGGRTIRAFVYVMRRDRPFGIPSHRYMETCLEGYESFRFDPEILYTAYDKSRKEAMK